LKPVIIIAIAVVLLVPANVFAIEFQEIKPSWTKGMGEAQTLATCLNFGMEHPDAEWCQEFGGDWLDETRAEIKENRSKIIQNDIPSMSVCNQMSDELKENRYVLEHLNSIEERPSLYLDTVQLDNEYRNYCMLTDGYQRCDVDLITQEIDSVPEQYHETSHYSSLWSYYNECKSWYQNQVEHQKIKAENEAYLSQFDEKSIEEYYQCWGEANVWNNELIKDRANHGLIGPNPDGGGWEFSNQFDVCKMQLEKTLESQEPPSDSNRDSFSTSEIECGTGTIEKNGQCVPDHPNTEPSSKGGGCLIATATYGSELAPQVQQLRELRDNSLLSTQSGTNFMNNFNDLYYSFSPVIADYERENPVFKEMVKVAITPMITSLSILNYVEMDSEIEVLGYGISLIVLNVTMYVGIPIFAIMRIRK
jgi:hypothetical protein